MLTHSCRPNNLGDGGVQLTSKGTMINRSQNHMLTEGTQAYPASRKVMSIFVAVLLGVSTIFAGMIFNATAANAAVHSDGVNSGEWELEVCIAPANPAMSTPTQWCDNQSDAWGTFPMITQAAYDTVPQTYSGSGQTLTVVARFEVTNRGPAATTAWWTGGYAAGGGTVNPADVLGYPRANNLNWCLNESTATSSPDYSNGVMPAGASVTFTCEVDQYATTGAAHLKMLPTDLDELASRGGQWNFVVGGQMTMCWSQDQTECNGIVEEWGGGSMELQGSGPGDQYVTATAPTVTPAATCGVPGTVNIPTVEGVVYTNHNPGVTEGNVRITAAADFGYTLDPTSDTEWNLTLPDIVDCEEPLIEVSPIAPTVSVSTVCDVPSTVTIPTVTGVVYTNHDETATSGPVRVTAAPATGYTFPEGTQTEWTLEVPVIVDCEELVEVSPVAPTVNVSTVCDVPSTFNIPVTDGVVYTNHNEGATSGAIRITAAPAAGYEFPEGTQTEWTLNVPAIVTCGEQLTVVSTGTPTVLPAATCDVPAQVTLPETPGVIYTNHNPGISEGTIRVTAAAADGFVIQEGSAIEWTAQVECGKRPTDGTTNTGGHTTNTGGTKADGTTPMKTVASQHLTATGSDMGSTVLLSAVGLLLIAGAAAVPLYMRRKQNA